MTERTVGYAGWLSVLVAYLLALFLGTALGASRRVLVVMSYEESFPWCQEIKEGIDAVLKDSCDIEYFYMNTKTYLQGGSAKAREAYELYQRFEPDGVIAVDDNAQAMFVVKYLKDKVKTPVMFCGVNAVPETYGYPCSNVSGMLERLHIGESIAFVKQLAPPINSVGFMMKAGPAADQVRSQVEHDQDRYQARAVGFKTPRTLDEALAMTRELKSSCDALFLETLQGVTDATGKPLPDIAVMPVIVRIFGKPTIGSNRYAVELGVLCAVIKTGQEQGRTAAQMLLKAMHGTSVSQILITSNVHGKRLINVNTMMELGIKPKSIMLRGSELVRTKPQSPQ